jgi:hypothetical protein
MTAQLSTAIEHWTARVAELERQLDAATKLSAVKAVAGELMRTRKALKDAEAKAGRSGPHPKRGASRQSGRRSVSSAAEPPGA